jgi:hypothetical protein
MDGSHLNIHVIPQMERGDWRDRAHRRHTEGAKRTRVVRRFWSEFDRANWDALRRFFTEDGYVDWVCTRERFTVGEFIEVMKAYPGENRLVTLQRLETAGNRIVTATEMRQPRTGRLHHAVTFFTFTADRIHSIAEYRTDGQDIPPWRKETGAGVPMPAQQSLAIRNTQ